MNQDIRMRGFERRHDVDEVLSLLDRRVRPLHSETIDVTVATGRVLAEDIVSPRDVPGFNRAAMDGYALRGEETFGATSLSPLKFEIVGEARPGHAFVGEVAAMQAIRIMTGAPVPDGVNAVLRAEDADEEGGHLLARNSVPPQKHVGQRGEDIKVNTPLLGHGRHLRPQDIGVIASVGIPTVMVHTRPRVDIIVTGDELLPPGEQPHDHMIVDTNSIVLENLVKRDGGIPAKGAVIPDDRETLMNAIRKTTGDVLLISGGSSVGTEDHAPGIIAEMGSLDVHGVAMRPSGPSGVGFLDERAVFLIPGNPVSCLCAYEFFAGPSIRRLGGRSMAWPHPRCSVKVGRKIVSEVGRVDFVRVRLTGDHVEPLAVAGASILSSTSRADGIVLVQKESEGHAPGDEVEVFLFDPPPGPF